MKIQGCDGTSLRATPMLTELSNIDSQCSPDADSAPRYHSRMQFNFLPRTPSKLPFPSQNPIDQLPCGNWQTLDTWKRLTFLLLFFFLQSNQKSLWSIDPITIWYYLLFFPSLSPVFSASDSTKTQWAIDSLQTCWKILANIQLFYSFQVCKIITSWQGSCIWKDFGETLEIPSLNLSSSQSDPGCWSHWR